MDVPSSRAVETDALVPGNFAILHRHGLAKGAPCIAAQYEGTSALRLVPLAYPDAPSYAFAPMHESALGGVAVVLPDARVEIDFASAVGSAATYGEVPADAIIAIGDGFSLRTRDGGYAVGYLDLKTGMISRGTRTDAWMAFEGWRVVDGSDADLSVFESSAWKGGSGE